ncbi:MAG: 50S ribosomal protein L29 [Oscillospiraceae bacterium]|nr:50S ribosomal protein L29 [Oscillospiraceae bacterium]
MKASEIRELGREEIQKKIKELKEELFNLRFQHAINQLDNPTRLNHVKKDIARSMTILREREITEQRNTAKGVALSDG